MDSPHTGGNAKTMKRLSRRRSVSAMVLGGLLCAVCFPSGRTAGAEPAAEMSGPADLPAAYAGLYSLSHFGPTGTPREAAETLEAAKQAILAGGGGLLAIGPEVCPDWTLPFNDAASSTRRNAPSVTIVDRRGGYETVQLPSNSRRFPGQTLAGRLYTRQVSQPIDAPYGVHSTIGLETAIVRGSNSYLQRILNDVPKGEDRRIYVPTIRGLAAGHHIALYNPNEVIVVKSLGWDNEKQQPYIVADVRHDHVATDSVYRMGIGSKHVVNALSITDHSQSDNQSMTVKAQRNTFADGDAFVFHAQLRNQANIMSALGDEGALCYGGDISNDLRPFRSTVEAFDRESGELVFAPGITRNFALGASRPLINMNVDKHVTQGVVYVIAPGHRDPWDPGSSETSGDTFRGEVFGGGAILGRETGWTQDVVGRFFAIDEPAEYLDPENDRGLGYTRGPDMRVYRWYHVRGLEDRPDGLQRLYVERTRWVSSIHNVPLLYRRENYSTTLGSRDRLVELRYRIAPGAYVSDISRGWSDTHSSLGRVQPSDSRTLGLAPSSDAGTAFDFEAGDAIVQAIGPDPWNPTGVRIRHHNALPSTIEDSSFTARNNGYVTVHSALQISGGGTSLEDADKRRKTGGPAFERGVDLFSTTGVGILFRAEVGEAAIRFTQPNGKPQPLVWDQSAGDRPGNARSRLSVDPASGAFQFRGGVLDAEGMTMPQGGGLSATAIPARNLRGIDVAVEAGQARVEVVFSRGETDGAYAVHVQPNWFAMDRVTDKTARGFVVEFSDPAPEGGAFDWQICR